MGLSAISILACLAQALLVGWVWRAERGQRNTSLMLLLLAALFGYHGAMALLGGWAEKYRAAYFGLTADDTDTGHIIATFFMASLVAGQVLARRVGRNAKGGDVHLDSASHRRVDMIVITVLAVTAVVATAAAGNFNIRSVEVQGESSFLTSILYYLLYPLLSLAAVLLTRELAPTGLPWLTRLPILVSVFIAALSGRRLSMAIVGITAYLALPEEARRQFTRRFLIAGVVGLFAAGAWMVPFRAYQLGQRWTNVSSAGSESAGIGLVLRQYWEFLGQPGQWSALDEAAEDLSGRADGHSFLSQVAAKQAGGAEPFLGACFLGGAAFVIPSVIWEAKTQMGLLYCESRSVGSYALPMVDYTPTILGETLADAGPIAGAVLMAAFGYVLDWLARRVRGLSWTARALFLCTLAQGLLTAEHGWLGLLLALRTLLILFVILGTTRWAWKVYRGSSRVQRSRGHLVHPTT